MPSAPISSSVIPVYPSVRRHSEVGRSPRWPTELQIGVPTWRPPCDSTSFAATAATNREVTVTPRRRNKAASYCEATVTPRPLVSLRNSKTIKMQLFRPLCVLHDKSYKALNIEFEDNLFGSCLNFTMLI